MQTTSAERVDRHRPAEQGEDAAAGDHGQRAEGERDRRRDHRAENEQEDEEEERRRQQLRPLGRAERFLLQGRGRRRRSPTASPAPAPDPRRDGPSSAGTVSRIASSSGTWKSTKTRAFLRSGPQRGKGAAVPGRDYGGRGIAPQRRHQPRALAVKCRAWSTKQDDEGRGLAEVALLQAFAAGGGGAGNAERQRREPVLHPQPGGSQHQAGHDHNRKPDQGTAAFHLRIPSPIGHRV